MFSIHLRWPFLRRSISGSTATLPGCSSSAFKFGSQLTHPLASVLLVVTDQHCSPASAIADFFGQNWPNLEMVLVNATSAPITVNSTDHRAVKTMIVRAKSVGELKNIAMYNATGEWCLPWQSDCRYGPGYVEWHMLRRSKNQPVLLQNPVGRLLPSGSEAPVEPAFAPFLSFHRFHDFVYDADGDDYRFALKWPCPRFEMQEDAGMAVRLFRHA